MSHLKESAKNRHPSPAGEGPLPTVLVWDQQPERRRAVEAIARDVGARPQRVDPSDCSCVNVQDAIGVVALEPESTGLGVDLQPLRMLASMQIPMLAHGEGADTWTLGTRCRPLLAGASALLDSGKPDFPRELGRFLADRLRKLVEDRQDRDELQATFARLGMVGNSRHMLGLFRTIVRLGVLSDFPVVVTGETGTGKELVARAIHQLDPKRRSGPFVPLNCNAVSPGLVESELFGHRRGAFTGATHDRRGLVRAAERGILFLDEIADLDAVIQGKLLRVLQEGRVLGVGDERETPIDVRVIAATNRSLPVLVAEGRFRADLWHRLGVLSVDIPPLRERPEDVRPLVESVLGRCGAIRGGQAISLDPECVAALQRLTLPGNAREVENLVRQSLATKDDQRPLSLRDLPRDVWEQLTASDAAEQQDGAPSGDGSSPTRACRHDGRDLRSIIEASNWSLSRTLSACERMLIEAALLQTSGSHARAARLLGVTSRTIYNKVHKHGTQRPTEP